MIELRMLEFLLANTRVSQRMHRLILILLPHCVKFLLNGHSVLQYSLTY